MPATANTLRTYLSQTSEALAETFWPTRCAVCERPGEVLCQACKQSLPYLDWWRACKRCGAPFGRVQCSECNLVMLARINKTEPPYQACASATTFESSTARIARTYKDHGERRLAAPMAELMVQALPPLWHPDAITFIPATVAARRKRGFDHGEMLAYSIALLLGIPLVSVFVRPRTRDQRALSRKERLTNMEGRFAVLPGASLPSCMLLIDDVYTTGATLFDATDALKRSGCATVYCLTFARVF